MLVRPFHSSGAGVTTTCPEGRSEAGSLERGCSGRERALGLWSVLPGWRPSLPSEAWRSWDWGEPDLRMGLREQLWESRDGGWAARSEAGRV